MNARRGFTLVEMLVVMALAAFIISIVGKVVADTATFMRRMEGRVTASPRVRQS